MHNSTAYNNFNIFKYDSIYEQSVDPNDVIGHKEDALDDLMIEDSYNDYVRDSTFTNDNNSDLQKYKKEVADNNIVKDINRKKNNLEMQMQNLNGNTKKEKRQIGEKVDSLPGKKNDKQNNSVG